MMERFLINWVVENGHPQQSWKFLTQVSMSFRRMENGYGQIVFDENLW